MHAHTHTHRPGDTCRSVPTGHRAFPRVRLWDNYIHTGNAAFTSLSRDWTARIRSNASAHPATLTPHVPARRAHAARLQGRG
eukprot:7189050-Prymnesium_polylepis.1